MPCNFKQVKSKLKRIFGYVTIKYSDSIKKGLGGYCLNITFLPVSIIKIRPKYKQNNDIGIHLHELKHAEQHRRYFLLFPLFYLFSKKFRLKMETEAYIEQLKCYKNPESCLKWLPKAFVEKYKFFKDIETAESYVKNKILSEV